MADSDAETLEKMVKPKGFCVVGLIRLLPKKYTERGFYSLSMLVI